MSSKGRLLGCKRQKSYLTTLEKTKNLLEGYWYDCVVKEDLMNQTTRRVEMHLG